MTMLRKTPGPWTLTHVEGTNFAIQRFELRGMFGDAPNISPIFNKNLSAIDGTTFYSSPGDAILIAAAPDLLGAAKALMYHFCNQPSTVGNVPDVWEDLLTAINKAEYGEGGQP